MPTFLPRRRFLAVTAAAALLPCVAHADGPELVRWQGKAFGGEVALNLYHPDPAVARDAIAAASAELARMEAIFSLHHPNSAVVRLNQAGGLDDAPAHLVRLLAEAAAVSELSDGAFDITVQPLWRLHADSLKATGLPPAAAALSAARALVDWRKVSLSGSSVRLAVPGMAVTLNGIARGYAADCLAALLEQRGFVHALVDLGDLRAIGPRGDHSPWPVAVRNPRYRTSPLQRIALGREAMSTTEALGASFPGYGKYGHLVDPANGQPALGVPSITVWADSAMRADALSTAIGVAGPARAGAILRAGGAARGLLVAEDGTATDL